jgi:hypothetical protein
LIYEKAIANVVGVNGLFPMWGMGGIIANFV